MEANPITSYIGIGSNLDDPQGQVRAALDALEVHDHCNVIHRSSLYASEPVGYADQPEFVNAVCAIETILEPHQLLYQLLNMEKIFGRVRTHLPNRPRRIDLDLLLYSTRQINSPDLTVPHPRMHERRFVLEPLVEIAPDEIIPGKGIASQLLEKCKDQEVVRIR